MINIEEESLKSFNKEINPETSSCECFFHYTDEKLYEVGFRNGVELMRNNIDNLIKNIGHDCEMKSISETFKDQSFIDELKRLKEFKLEKRK